jgi:hypothetical protein
VRGRPTEMTLHSGFQPLIELDVGGTGRVGLSAAGLSAIITDTAIACAIVVTYVRAHASVPDKLRSLVQDRLGRALYNLTVHWQKVCRGESEWRAVLVVLAWLDRAQS